MRKIIHLDADCFFAAVEMRDNPALAQRPIAVGGSADRRGVISTCNYLARQFGVRSAMATATALRLCPQLLVVPGQMEKYRQASQQIFAIYRQYSDVIEPLSLDEAYLDVSNSSHCAGSATLIAAEIRQRVRQAVGLTVSAGVAPNKFLAKVASDWQKPNGLFVIRPDQVEAFVLDLPVSKLHGVGKVTAQKLSSMEIHTCADVRAQSLTLLEDRFGRFGERLWHLSHGRDERSVAPREARKSVSVEHTYATDLPGISACEAALPDLHLRLLKRLQQHKQGINRLFIKLKFNDFQQTTVERRGQVEDLALYRDLCHEAYARGCRPVRLLGVGARFVDGNGTQPQQLPLFAHDSTELN